MGQAADARLHTLHHRAVPAYAAHEALCGKATEPEIHSEALQARFFPWRKGADRCQGCPQILHGRQGIGRRAAALPVYRDRRMHAAALPGRVRGTEHLFLRAILAAACGCIPLSHPQGADRWRHRVHQALHKRFRARRNAVREAASGIWHRAPEDTPLHATAQRQGGTLAPKGQRGVLCEPQVRFLCGFQEAAGSAQSNLQCIPDASTGLGFTKQMFGKYLAQCNT